jgi:tetratricopeptide (TPR) repeat protein
MSTSADDSVAFREQGNQAFKQGHFQEAIDRYTDAINILNDLQLTEINKNDLTKCYSNRSQCYINLSQYDDAVEDATRGT